MLKDLVLVANKLDSVGLSKEADVIDSMIEKYSMIFDDGYLQCDGCYRRYPEGRNVKREGMDLCPDCSGLGQGVERSVERHHREDPRDPE
jgi:hypothetical protein